MLMATAFSIVFICYLFIPGLGGMRARARWRRFRDRIRNSSLLPKVSFKSGTNRGPLGAHRFIGRIEALQGDDSLWVRGNGLTVLAVMSGADIYLMPSEGATTPDARTLLEERFPEMYPSPMPWRRMTSLQEGTKIYLVGFLESRDGVLRMYGSREVPLLAILHEGQDIVPRAVWSGRQKNEYWNAVTPWALLAGSLALFSIATAAFSSHQASPTARLALTGALFPLLPLLPPGVVFYLVYSANWRHARFLRAERDLLALSAYLRAGDAVDEMAGWGDGLPRDTIPLIRSCRRRALMSELGAALAFLAGISLNTVLTLVILNAVT